VREPCRKVKSAVITVPAYFNDSQRQATKVGRCRLTLSTPHCKRLELNA